MKSIKVGIYGDNGHQILRKFETYPSSKAELIAVCEYKRNDKRNGVIEYETLEEMLQDERIDMISLCSPKRKEQAKQAILCMKAGKHVYAEKPCAMTEEELDMIIETANKTGMRFHEMAGTAFSQPYYAMSKIVKSGIIGEVIQVFAQKSYPLNIDVRPQDEDIDGGLLCQAGIHAIRFIEHVAGVKIKKIYAIETKKGNPYEHQGNLHTAASYMMYLENGGVASAIANYLNPKKGFGKHGNEHLRIFGTLGLIEATDGGEKTRLVLQDRDMGPIDVSEPGKDYFDMYIDSLLGINDMPFTLEEELHPTRMVIRAKAFCL